jgi:hypothetical protein
LPLGVYAVTARYSGDARFGDSSAEVTVHIDRPVKGVILDTAIPAVNPEVGLGVGGGQWIGARFSISQPSRIVAIGAELSGFSTIFAAIVPLDSRTGLPAFSPTELESHVLASVAFPVPQSISTRMVPLDVILEPGDYGVLFGVGLFGTGGFANLATGNTPTSQASFFSAEFFVPNNPPSWYDWPASPGMRILVYGDPDPE